MSNYILSPIIINSKLDDSYNIDHPQRLEMKGLARYYQKLTLDEVVSKSVKGLFQHRYRFACKRYFKNTWKLVSLNNIWDSSTPLTLGKLRAIDRCFVYHGRGIPAPKTVLSDTSEVVKVVIQSLLHGGKLTSALLHKPTLEAILIKKDPQLLAEFHKELQHELNHLIANPPTNANEEFIWRAFLGNVIALLPFTYPKNDTKVTLPVLKNGVCRPVEYTMQVLPLEVTKLSSPMLMLGLSPVNDAKASHVLTYLATTFPAGDGYAGTLLADFTPNKSVGEAVYERNKAVIDGWMMGKKDIYGAGTSLGGALMMLTLIHHSEKLARIDLYNPPGLYENCWEKPISTNCKVNIFNQYGDLVSKLGFFPTTPNVSLYAVTSKDARENFLSAHSCAFTGCPEVSIVQQDPKIENNDTYRKMLTKLHKRLGPVVVYHPIKSVLIARDALKGLHRDWNPRLETLKKNCFAFCCCSPVA